MEALLEKEGEVEKWNDDRLDELSRRMDAGFKEMKEGFSSVDQRFERVHDRLDKLFYLQFAFMGSLALGLLTDTI
jgi:ribosome assembly protein YihI (activator of Der GTPase)